MKRHRLPAWLAGLALLIHLLSMPLSGVPADAGRLLDGSDPAPAAQGEHALHLLHAAATPAEHPHDGHAGMPPCCCTGAMGLAALPGATLPSLEAAGRSYAPGESHASQSSPRERWPAINPRASPHA